MGYWARLEEASGLGGYYPWVLLGCVVSRTGRGDRARRPPPGALRGRYAGAVVRRVRLCALLSERGLDDTIGRRWLHFAGQLFIAVGIVNTAVGFLLRVVLAPFHVRPPTILRDTALGIAYIVLTSRCWATTAWTSAASSLPAPSSRPSSVSACRTRSATSWAASRCKWSRASASATGCASATSKASSAKSAGGRPPSRRATGTRHHPQQCAAQGAGDDPRPARRQALTSPNVGAV